jgi:AcrR family transcriptional regulator
VAAINDHAKVRMSPDRHVSRGVEHALLAPGGTYSPGGSLQCDTPATWIGDPRRRILDALVSVVCERGYGSTAVGLVVARARISRRTFYEQFDDLDDCFLAVLDLGLTLPAELIGRAFAGEDDWRAGVLAALEALLQFFDNEPGLTQMWFSEALTIGAWALERRERNIAAVRTLVVASSAAAGSTEPDLVLAQGVMSAVLGLLTTHVVTKRRGRLITMIGPLTRLVMAPFLPEAAVLREVTRAERRLAAILVGAASDVAAAQRGPGVPKGERPWCGGALAGPDVALPVAVANPSATRARQCLRSLAEQNRVGITPSNREIGAKIGIRHPSQTSKLLSRLESVGLVAKRRGAPGRPHAWGLTPEGKRVIKSLWPDF